MSKTRVVNVKHDKFDEYIGRAVRARKGGFYGYSQSLWANPFKIGPDGTRQKCLDRYEDWIRITLSVRDPNFKKSLLALDGKVLGCWCKPKACHGDILVKLIEELKEAEHGEEA